MKEADIRPQDLFARYLDLARADAGRMAARARAFISVPCPACGLDRPTAGLAKLGFQYVVCGGCGTLYVSPRPPRAMLEEYYREGEAVRFWSSDFFRQTAEARRERMFRPRAERIAALARQSGYSGEFADIGSGYGIFLEEVDRQRCFRRVIGIEPGPGLAQVCRERGYEIVEQPLEALAADRLQCDLATAFEVLEHVFEPREFLAAARGVLRPGGCVFFTTLTVSGFDIQTLWEHSNSVFPPHHLNLISVEGMRTLVGRVGLELAELTTPGQLDVDIVANAWRQCPGLPRPRFLEALVLHSEPAVAADFQEFLRRNRLSSHIQVVARRPA